MVDFGAIIDKLVDIGFYRVILPFLLVYVVVFGILEKSGIFSKKTGNNTDKDSKDINAIIAFVFGLFVVASIQTVLYIQKFITIAITFIVFILVVLILLGFIFGDQYIQLLFDDKNKIKQWIGGTLALIVCIISIWALFYVLDIWDVILDWFSAEIFWSVIGILGFGLILYLITKD